MINTYKQHKIVTSIRGRQYEAEIFNRAGDLVGVITKPAALTTTDEMVAEARAIINEACAPLQRAEYVRKD
jgi:hypothetical protein